MRTYDLVANPVVRLSHFGGLVDIMAGQENARLREKRAVEGLRHIYTADAGLLVLGNGAEELVVPPRSVVKIEPGIEHRFDVVDEKSPLFVFDVVGEPNIPSCPFPVAPTNNELSYLVTSSVGGHVRLFTDDSRYRTVLDKEGKLAFQKSGWFTHRDKGTPLGIADVEWSSVRDGEVEHYHKFVLEGYLVTEGLGWINVRSGSLEKSEEFRLSPGTLFVVEPSILGQRERHKIMYVTGGGAGRAYRHVCINFGSLPGEPGERVVTPT